LHGLLIDAPVNFVATRLALDAPERPRTPGMTYQTGGLLL
jgi:hypothetical protein